jgi:dUTP pyrophosphatase
MLTIKKLINPSNKIKQWCRQWLGITENTVVQPHINYQLWEPLTYKVFKKGKYAPMYATKGSAGIDLVSRVNTVIPAKGNVKLDSGIAMEIPKGYCGLILGRSGFAFKEGITAYHIGLIDSDYRGQIGIALTNHKDTDHKISIGDMVAQILIIPYLQAEFHQVNELNHTERGSNGFGSTGTSL